MSIYLKQYHLYNEKKYFGHNNITCISASGLIKPSLQ